MLFVCMDDGMFEPARSMYSDIADGSWRKAGVLLASSIVMSGPAANFLAPWLYNFIVGGTEGVLKSLPSKLLGHTTLIDMYNKVCLIFTKVVNCMQWNR